MSESVKFSERRVGFFKGCAIIGLSVLGADQFMTNGFVRDAAIEAYQDYSDASKTNTEINYNEVSLTNPNSGWIAHPEGEALIDSLDMPVHQKEFVKFVFNGVKLVLENGGQTNPHLLMAIPVIETGYGTDGLSKRTKNYYGSKGATKECGSVESETFEEINGERIDIVDSFKCYNGPYDSFIEFEETLHRLPHFNDVIACSSTLDGAVNALQHEVDPNTCEIIAYQQSISPVSGERVLGHATASNYVEVIHDVAQFIHADELFTPA